MPPFWAFVKRRVWIFPVPAPRDLFRREIGVPIRFGPGEPFGAGRHAGAAVADAGRVDAVPVIDRQVPSAPDVVPPVIAAIQAGMPDSFHFHHLKHALTQFVSKRQPFHLYRLYWRQ